MGWSQRHATIRLVREGWADDPTKVMKPFEAYEIYNDACAPPAERWTVQAWPTSPAVTYPWYAVITEDDDARTRYVKWSFACQVAAARKKVHEAQRELRRLET